MSDERDFDRLARAWLELGPSEAPDRAVSAVLLAVETTPQVRRPSQRTWRFPNMTRYAIAGAVVVALVVLVGGGLLLSRSNDQSTVGGAVPSASALSSAPGGAAPSDSPSGAVPSATPAVFASERYGYVVSLPAAWSLTSPASATWDGTGAPGFDTSVVDLFKGPTVVAWAVAAPTDLTLAAYATQTSEMGAAEHGCPPKPETDEPIVVGGETARLLTTHCGILVMSAVMIHNGIAVVFAFQAPFGSPTTDPADRAQFLSFLTGIQFST